MKKLIIAAAVLGLAAPLFAQTPAIKTETAAPAAAAPVKDAKKTDKKSTKKPAKKAAKKGAKVEEASKTPATAPTK